MRPLDRIQSIVFVISSVALAAGAGCYAFLVARPAAAVVFLVGALGFCVLQQQQIAPLHHHPTLTLRRLHAIMTIAHVLFVLAGLLMAEEQFQPVGKWLADRDTTGGSRYISFITLTHGKWVVMLLIAAILELYTTQRISHELSQD